MSLSLTDGYWPLISAGCLRRRPNANGRHAALSLQPHLRMICIPLVWLCQRLLTDCVVVFPTGYRLVPGPASIMAIVVWCFYSSLPPFFTTSLKSNFCARISIGDGRSVARANFTPAAGGRPLDACGWRQRPATPGSVTITSILDN